MPTFDPKKPFVEVDDSSVSFDPSKPFKEVELETEPVQDPDKEITDFVTRAFLEPAGEVISTVAKPLEAIGEAIDPYTGAPVRAFVGEVQRGGGITSGLKKGYEQIKAGEVLPDTPSGEDISYTGQVQAGINPEFAKKSSKVTGPLVGAGLDLTQLIPGTPLLKGAKTVSEAIPAGIKTIGKGLDIAGDVSKRGLFEFGEIMTQGNLKPGKAMRASENLTGLEMLFPGSKEFGASKKAMQNLGKYREVLKEQPVTIPGSFDQVVKIKDYIDNNAGRSIKKAPNMATFLDNLNERLAVNAQDITDPLTGIVTPAKPKDFTIDEIDDLVTNLDTMAYTPQGYDRNLGRLLTPIVKKPRSELNKLISEVPQGQLFQQLKTKSEALLTAGSKRSKLMEAISSLGYGGAVMNPAALAMRTLSPRTYYQIVGAGKLTREAMDKGLSILHAGYENKNIKLIRDGLTQLAENYPEAAERMIRASLLAPSKYDEPENIEQLEARP